MSGSTPAFDPYRSPEDVQQYAPPSRTGGRPGFLTFVAVVAIVLGALGLMSVAGQFVGLVFNKQMQTWANSLSQGDLDDKAQKIQKEMQAEVNALADKYRLYGWLQMLVHLPLSIALLVGGVRTMGLKPNGRTILMIACAVAAMFVVGRGIVQVVLAIENMAIVGDYMPRMMEAQSPTGQIPAEAKQMLANAQKVGAIVAVAFSVGFVLALLTFYLVSFFYLQKDSIRDLFPQPDPMKMI